MTNKMVYQAAAAAPVQGAVHARSGHRCEDAALSYSTDDYALAVVADGHGSPDACRAAEGASYAVRVTAGALCQMLDGLVHDGTMEQLQDASEDADHARSVFARECEQLKETVTTRWLELVREDVEMRPYDAEHEYKQPRESTHERYEHGEASEHMYGTTVVACVAGKGFWFVLRLGDSSVAVRCPDGWHLPLPPDNLPGQYSYSLCSADALEHMVSAVGFDESPLALVVASDGVDKSYPTHERQFEFYDNMLRVCVERGVDRTMVDIGGGLQRITEEGSGDDIAVALVVHVDEDGKAIASLAEPAKVAESLEENEMEMEEVDMTDKRKQYEGGNDPAEGEVTQDDRERLTSCLEQFQTDRCFYVGTTEGTYLTCEDGQAISLTALPGGRVRVWTEVGPSMREDTWPEMLAMASYFQGWVWDDCAFRFWTGEHDQPCMGFDADLHEQGEEAIAGLIEQVKRIGARATPVMCGLASGALTMAEAVVRARNLAVREWANERFLEEEGTEVPDWRA